jgi:hypothetical protein
MKNKLKNLVSQIRAWFASLSNRHLHEAALNLHSQELLYLKYKFATDQYQLLATLSDGLKKELQKNKYDLPKQAMYKKVNHDWQIIHQLVQGYGFQIINVLEQEHKVKFSFLSPNIEQTPKDEPVKEEITPNLHVEKT